MENDGPPPPAIAVQAFQHLLGDARIGPTAKIVYLNLIDSPPAWRASAQTVADMTGIGITATRTALRDLEAAGWITMDRTVSLQGGRFTAPRIHVHDAPQQPPNAHIVEDGYT